MPQLSCAAMSCIYNKDEYCSKGDIRVGGNSATEPDETCCESFVERKGESTSNSVGVPSSRIEVSCEACNCVYNDDYVCEADDIDIAGRSAHQSRETACGTFDCE